MLYKDLKGNIVGESIFANGDIPDLLISIEFLGPVLWALIKNEDGTYFRDSTDHHIEPVLSQGLIQKLDKLYEIYMTSFDDSYPPDSGFHSIEEVRYYLYYKIYVATLLSCEYKQGKVLLYGNNHEPVGIEEYIKQFSTFSDEDLKSWLRPDLQ
jgi:hypothetical protein